MKNIGTNKFELKILKVQQNYSTYTLVQTDVLGTDIFRFLYHVHWILIVSHHLVYFRWRFWIVDVNARLHYLRYSMERKAFKILKILEKYFLFRIFKFKLIQIILVERKLNNPDESQSSIFPHTLKKYKYINNISAAYVCISWQSYLLQ